MQNQDFGSTQYFKVEKEPENGVKVILAAVYEALTEKGYNPVDQIVGYIMSGDPTYITSHKNARGMIMRAERDEIVEEMRNTLKTITGTDLPSAGSLYRRAWIQCGSWDWISGQRQLESPSVTLCF